MVSQKTKVINPSGMHARPASELAKLASKCESDITIKVGEKNINPKSILNIMSAAIRCGTDIVVECSGETEKEDLAKIIEAIESGLGE
ncbi:HPr family phosphocarrier protein [Mobilitalea sibirica]|uniref:Phosphocarrier protein HPr n=1 Tax=Mobilitalea sibirica TaxID=1462919 RepID=A0A8J7KZH9_9FIRM|nr:HPr family phosphocarrier protein [Mobilitalea sibirica]MBH1940233.1 HPr family phosphocarrier protein [Mobilitalea sibirica]